MIELEIPLNKIISDDELKSLVLAFGGTWSEPDPIADFAEGSLGTGDILVLVNYDGDENEIIVNIGGDWEKGRIIADKFIAAAKAKWGEAIPVAA